jgi:NAD(P)-dependent dehydrogenase (short-subunit alcohol dehydrogenase family)
MTKQRWNTNDIEDQTGRVAIVTGANSGIGFEAAKALAEKGAHVIVASRNKQRGQQAVANIAKAAPQASVELMLLDLASLASVKEFVTDFTGRFDRLDLLLNNAGVMMPKQREETEDGFELQFGTNHLGHFAFTVQLLPLLVATEGSRVVNVSSNAQDLGQLNLDDLQWTERPFKRIASYSASKIANMLFTLELQRRLQDAGVSTIAAACHPGYTSTNLQRNSWLLRWLNPILCMEPWQGALPTLYAAVSRDVEGGGYYGPNGFRHLRGYPAPDKPAEVSTDADAAKRLWELSEEHAGVTAPSLA